MNFESCIALSPDTSVTGSISPIDQVQRDIETLRLEYTNHQIDLESFATRACELSAKRQDAERNNGTTTVMDSYQLVRDTSGIAAFSRGLNDGFKPRNIIDAKAVIKELAAYVDTAFPDEEGDSHVFYPFLYKRYAPDFHKPIYHNHLPTQLQEMEQSNTSSSIKGIFVLLSLEQQAKEQAVAIANRLIDSSPNKNAAPGMETPFWETQLVGSTDYEGNVAFNVGTNFSLGYMKRLHDLYSLRAKELWGGEAEQAIIILQEILLMVPDKKYPKNDTTLGDIRIPIFTALQMAANGEGTVAHAHQLLKAAILSRPQLFSPTAAARLNISDREFEEIEGGRLTEKIDSEVRETEAEKLATEEVLTTLRGSAIQYAADFDRIFVVKYIENRVVYADYIIGSKRHNFQAMSPRTLLACILDGSLINLGLRRDLYDTRMIVRENGLKGSWNLEETWDQQLYQTGDNKAGESIRHRIRVTRSPGLMGLTTILEKAKKNNYITPDQEALVLDFCGIVSDSLKNIFAEGGVISHDGEVFPYAPDANQHPSPSENSDIFIPPNSTPQMTSDYLHGHTSTVRVIQIGDLVSKSLLDRLRMHIINHPAEYPEDFLLSRRDLATQLIIDACEQLQRDNQTPTQS